MSKTRKTRIPAARTSAPPRPVREATAGCEPYDTPLFNANFEGPKENSVALGLDGSVAWVEPSERFAMGYRVTPEQRDAGFVPTAEELMAGYTTCYERDPATGKLVVVLDCECRKVPAA
jgi:hypothetical protein